MSEQKRVDFPSFEFVSQLQQYCNDDDHFMKVSRWSDVSVVLDFGGQRYWLKLYGGRIIDVMEYTPMSNPLGYDIIISGATDAWKELVSGTKTYWNQTTQGRLTEDGNLVHAHRMHEAIVRMVENFPKASV